MFKVGLGPAGRRRDEAAQTAPGWRPSAPTPPPCAPRASRCWSAFVRRRGPGPFVAWA
ncbi:hypothetical protein ACRAWD_04115 [Caulobacter segnis]